MSTNGLPSGWALAPIGELLAPLEDGRTLHHGWSPQCEKEPVQEPGDWGVLKTTAVQYGEFLPQHNKRLPAHLKPRPNLEVKVGDLLLTCAGPRVRCGVACLVRHTPGRLLLSGKMYRFRVRDGIDPRYVEAFFQSEEARIAIDAMKTGISDSGLNLTHERFKALVVPLAPLRVQEQIVAEIEKQFTRLDAGVEALKRLQAHLRRYRAAVLKAACEGRLVPTEASLGRPYETGRELVLRAAAALGRMRREGGTRHRGSQLEPASAPFPVPKGWACARLGDIAALQGGLTKGQKRRPEDVLRSVPYLRVANVQRGFLNLSEMKTIEATEEEISQLQLKRGDILFNEGGDRDKLGRGWIWNEEIAECIHQNHVFRARLVVSDIEPKFVSWYGNSFGQVYFLEQGKQTTNLASINITKLSALPVPIPPAAEQRRIVAEVEAKLSDVDTVESVVSSNLLRAAGLRSAILRAAFDGRLGRQPDSGSRSKRASE